MELTNLVMDTNSNMLDISIEELSFIDGGRVNASTIAGAAGSVYGAVVGAGSIGWLGAGALAVCTAPIVAGSGAVVGIAGGVLAIYGLAH